MKKLILMMLITGLGLSACSRKEESPEPASRMVVKETPGNGGSNLPSLTATSPVQFWGKIDGTVSGYQAPAHISMFQIDSTAGTDSTTASYGGGMVDSAGIGIMATRGKITYAGQPVPGPLFASLFSAGYYGYEDGITEITYLGGGSGIYSTTAGDQSGSSFQISDVVATGTNENPKFKVVMKFNCKVYNVSDPSQSKTITDGIMVAEFAANK
ncbi:MAG TPA: hypothetical protein VEC12_00645 [Bacteroidia bacterium]|nr:hypothetical protein [Bacteroidia bacterium]